MVDLTALSKILSYQESSTYYFYSTAAQCIAALTGLSGALCTFHYQNLMSRIREKRDKLFEKYDPMSAGLKEKYQEKYRQCRTVEEYVDFWHAYFSQEDRKSHHHMAFEDLYSLIKTTRRFRFLVVRLSVYGLVVLLPYGIVGTLSPSLGGATQWTHLVGKLVYLGLLGVYLTMSLSLTRSVFVSPWDQK